MTCTLTTSIAVPNITRWRIADVNFQDSASTVQIGVVFMSAPAGGREKKISIEISNTSAETIIKSAVATGFADDVVRGPRITVSGAYDRLEAAYNGGTKAARMRNLETALAAESGIIASALQGTIA
ncbi:MAG TPA: hypothetical protein VEA41_01855 [Salinarimonas sp.]|nr:hypothetical protein [Salinarimonas sp.]